jgi:hypothetical protein
VKNFKSIAERNAEFAGMTKMEKRVALAKDVLTQMELQNFIPTPGTYIDSFGGYDKDEFGVTDYGKPIIQETCNVCALGALTLSLLDGDAVNSTGRNKVSCHDALDVAGLWSTKETEDIERAFEGGHYRDAFGNYSHQPEAEFRMKEIMLNIIQNDGIFNGKQLPFKY